MKPTIGRIVHFVSADDSRHAPAIVSEVLGTEGHVTLHAFERHGTVVRWNVAEDPTGKTPNTWHWPERE
jgi:hypothetical protein